MKEFNNELADSAIKNHMIMAMGAGLVPIPILDIAGVTAIQLDMIRQICKVYKKNFNVELGKSLVTSIGGSILARMGASTMKAIPIVGSILGGITMAALSGASTYAIGNVFKEHFKHGGNLSDIDLKKAKDFFKEKFEEGKKVAENLKPEKNKVVEKEEETFTVKVSETVKKPKPPKERSTIEHLEALANLKAEGLLTDEEFEIMKKKVINRDKN